MAAADHPKLLVNDKVEVRNVEDGFQGSWHTATVIARDNLVRRVKYDNILCDDGFEHLIEIVQVSPVVDGIFSAGDVSSKIRGFIRPIPPELDVCNRSLCYGQCVDVNYRDAWWEGVVFDHYDGSEERNIFFPDMGDELNVKIGMMRISQDWDEATEMWNHRGKWLFLELIELVQQVCPLPVSVQQIWYDVRLKNDFKNLQDWTSSSRDIWKQLVLQVLVDNLRFTFERFVHNLNSSGDLFDVSFKSSFQMDGNWLFSSDQNYNLVQPGEAETDQKGLTASEDGYLDRKVVASSIVLNHEEELPDTSALTVSSSDPYKFPRPSPTVNKEDSFGVNAKMNKESLEHTARKGKYRWLPANADMVDEAECRPNAVAEYLKMSKCKQIRSCRNDLMLNARKHLSFLGWKIEYIRDFKDVKRMRYISPDGVCYASLLQACQNLSKHMLQSVSMSSENQTSRGVPSDNLDSYEAIKQVSDLPSLSNAFEAESHGYPEYVVDYYLLGLDGKNVYNPRIGVDNCRNLKLKVKDYLSSNGWSFLFRAHRGDTVYISPNGKHYFSLRAACKGCIDEEKLCMSGHSITRSKQIVNVKQETEYSLHSNKGSVTSKGFEINLASDVSTLTKGHTGLSKIESGQIEKVSKKRKNGMRQCLPDELRVTKKGKQSKSLIKWNIEDSLVLNPTRIAREVASPSSSSRQRNPRTILSQLIDNNVVLPNTKVYYRNRKDGRPMAEGRISREGITCSCCDKVFMLSNFEAHAGSKYHRPSANILLEDGRSLLDCQLQLTGNGNMKRWRTDPCRMKSDPDGISNDYICSICWFGGELVLCDQCPSSFHTECLGLKELPDGDWFCPSCCCGLCGEGKFNKDAEQLTDKSLLRCDQCERQYHFECASKKGLVEPHSSSREKWFCKRRCKEVFLGLQRLLGKRIPLANNLTWTLLKQVGLDNSDNASSEALTENYSKLNVALEVMHECFELIKEPRTRTDLVEDVIFNRRSELNRLNFQGFYTVLLERSDEVITVANVRIYGEKVAEVPLIGTRFQYRRLGMCRILMDELEKELIDLGIERLVLPAVSGMLNTWISSFGFSTMTESERFDYLGYIFLDFQGTVMCHKLLKETSSIDSSSRKGFQQKHDDNGDINTNKNFELDGTAAVSEVCQVESDLITQVSMQITGGKCGETDCSMAPDAVTVKPPTYNNCKPCQSEIIKQGCSFQTSGLKGTNGNGIFKFYHRRKMPACGS